MAPHPASLGERNLRCLAVPPEARDGVEHLGGGAHRAQQMPLHFGAAGAAHQFQLLGRLDAFRGGFDAQTRAQFGDGELLSCLHYLFTQLPYAQSQRREGARRPASADSRSR
jgi:hypothetical protein